MWHTRSSQQPQSIHSAVSCLSPSADDTEHRRHHCSLVLILLINARIQVDNLVSEWERFYVWMHPIIFVLFLSAGYFWWRFTKLSRSEKELQQATWKVNPNHQGVSWTELCEPFVTMCPGGLLIAGVDNAWQRSILKQLCWLEQKLFVVHRVRPTVRFAVRADECELSQRLTFSSDT